MPASDSQIQDRQSTLAGIMARLWWMFLGNILLAFSLLFIVQNGGRFFHVADWVFWIALASLVLIRYVDIRFLGGCTGTGEPTSVRHWTRYAAVLTLCSTAAWILAHVANSLFVAKAAQG